MQSSLLLQGALQAQESQLDAAHAVLLGGLRAQAAGGLAARCVGGGSVVAWQCISALRDLLLRVDGCAI